MTAREEAARLEAVRLLDLAAAKVQSAQQLLQQPGWRDQVSTAYAAAEEAATEITKATKQAKKAEKGGCVVSTTRFLIWRLSERLKAADKACHGHLQTVCRATAHTAS